MSDRSPNVRWSIKWKWMTVITVFIVFLTAIHTYFHLTTQQQLMEGELQKRIALLKENLVERGRNTIITLSHQVENDIAQMNFSGALEAIANLVADNEEIKYAILMNASRVVLLHSLTPQLVRRRLDSPRDRWAASSKTLNVKEFQEAGDAVIELAEPLQISTQPWGTLRLIYTTQYLKQEVAASRRQIKQEGRRVLLQTLLTSAIFAFLGVAFIYFLALKVTRPIIQLTRRAYQISTGDFSVRESIQVSSRDELGVLAQAFTEMGEELKLSYEKLAEYNRTLEQRVLERTEELDRRNVELDKISRMKSEFIANMSHEIRTPLNAIVGMTGLLLEMPLPIKIRHYLGTLKTSALTLFSLINDILDFSKIEAGKLTLVREPFKLSRIMEELVDLFLVETAKQHIELVLGLDPYVPDLLVGDPLRLRQVLINLTNNAVKFTHTGEIDIRVKLRSHKGNKVVLVFSIRDTGIGIAPEHLPNLFEAFTQADGSTTRKYGGTGLGLTISKKLVGLMQGKIHAESEPEVGSTFYFTLPFEVVSEEIPKKPLADLKGKRVLVVDGSASVREALSGLLSRCGDMDIETQASPKKAFEPMLSSSVRQPWDLIFLSAELNESEAKDWAESIRNTPGLQAPPIILMAPFGHHCFQEINDPAAVNLLTKPVKPSHLQAILMRIFAPHRMKDAEEKAFFNFHQGTFSQVLNGACILVVEDEPINQLVVREILTQGGGARITLANDGIAALKCVRDTAFDLILMDLHMPSMDGYEVARRIRSESANAGPPIIAMTANISPGEIEACRAAGMQDAVVKPLMGDTLFPVLASYLERPKGPSAVQGQERMERIANPLSSSEASMVNGLTGRWRNMPLMEALLKEFNRQYKHCVEKIEAALKQSDRETAIHLVHAVKGAAGNVDAHDLHKAAENLERALREECDGAFEPQMEAFRRALSEYLAGIQNMPGVSTPPHAYAHASQEADTRMLVEDLAELDRLLKDHNLKSKFKIEKLYWPLSDVGLADEVFQLKTHISRFDFKHARRVLQTIRQNITSRQGKEVDAI